MHSVYFESDDPFPCGEILKAAFIGTNLIGVARFRGRRDFEEIQYGMCMYVCMYGCSIGVYVTFRVHDVYISGYTSRVTSKCMCALYIPSWLYRTVGAG